MASQVSFFQTNSELLVVEVSFLGTQSSFKRFSSSLSNQISSTAWKPNTQLLVQGRTTENINLTIHGKWSFVADFMHEIRWISHVTFFLVLSHIGPAVSLVERGKVCVHW